MWRVEIEGKVSEVSYSADGNALVAATGTPGVSGEAILLSAADGKITSRFGGHTDAVYAAKLSNDGKLLATAGYDRRILIHDVQTGDVLQTMSGHNGSVFSLAFDASGQVLCTASADSTVKVWNVASGQRLDTLSQPQGEQYSVVISADGERIYAAGADNRIRIWKLLSRDSQRINPQLVSRFAHEQNIGRLVMSADGSRLATAADDGTIRVWNAWPLKHLASLPLQTRPVSALSFVGTEKLLVCRLDGSSELLDVNAEQKGTPGGAQVATTSMAVLPDKLFEAKEADGNNSPATAQSLPLPFVVSGAVNVSNAEGAVSADHFKFAAKAGQRLVVEVRAARDKSPLDSKIEVLTKDGKPILQTQLQAVRDSYFTFRGKDSNTSGDFRVFNWQEMELNEYLYSDGEVVRLWLYPRGPDSGFNVYPGFGSRYTYFGSTPTAHALQAPCFIVVPRQPGEKIVANGLPVFPVYFENDDDGRRELGRDSRVMFVAPADGEYVVRVTDARGFHGSDYRYKLTVRSPRPSFSVSMSTRKLTLQPGTGREIVFNAKRVDGFEGPITITADGLPEGYGFSGPVKIQQGQLRAFGSVYAKIDAKPLTPEQVKAVKFTAKTDSIGSRDVGSMEELKLSEAPKLRVRIGKTLAEAAESQKELPVFRIRPGQTIRGMLATERLNHNGVVSFGKEDSGRNLPHGVFVDNIGLNGLLLLGGQSEREFFITASKIAEPGIYPFYIRANIDGVTSFPAQLEVVPLDEAGQKVTTR